MQSLNRVELLGNVGQDPKVTLGKSVAITKFTLATSHKSKGEEVTQWHNITAFGMLAEMIAEGTSKGDRLFVAGRLTYSQTEAADGTKRYYTDIIAEDVIFLTKKREQQPATVEEEKDGAEESSDDVPF